jgi:hypothetical protein
LNSSKEKGALLLLSLCTAIIVEPIYNLVEAFPLPEVGCNPNVGLLISNDIPAENFRS